MKLRGKPLNGDRVVGWGKLGRAWLQRIGVWRESKPSGPRLASFPFVSGDTFRAMADIVIETSDDLERTLRAESRKVPRDSRLIFVSSEMADLVLPRWPDDIPSDSLIIHNKGFVDESSIHLYSPKFRYIYAINVLNSKANIVSIPLGLENATWKRHGDPDAFSQGYPWNRDKLLAVKRNHKLLCSIKVDTNPTARSGLAERFGQEEGVVIPRVRLSPSQHRNLLLKSKFVLAPPGSRPDTHRAWEAIYLGCIPVVLRHTWPLKDAELPVLLVDDWDEALRMLKGDVHDLYRSLSSKSAEAAYFPYYAALMSR